MVLFYTNYKIYRLLSYDQNSSEIYANFTVTNQRQEIKKADLHGQPSLVSLNFFKSVVFEG